jgi:hypothetical protein
MSLQLKINYPETLPDAVGKTREQFEQEANVLRVGDIPLTNIVVAFSKP